MRDGTDRCFACDKPLKSLKIHEVQVLTEDTIVWVGPDCYKKVINAGKEGYKPPKGGPILIIP